MKDIFTLNDEEKQNATERIERAIADIQSKKTCMIVAETLYNSRYSAANLFNDNPDKGEILEDLCQMVFCCSFDEVLKAYDNWLA